MIEPYLGVKSLGLGGLHIKNSGRLIFSFKKKKNKKEIFSLVKFTGIITILQYKL